MKLVHKRLIVQFMKSKLSCLKYLGLVLLTGGGEAERGGSAIQIEVPAAVVSHVWKIGLNWSKWANLRGKETWRRADSILGISEPLQPESTMAGERRVCSVISGRC